MPKPRYTFLEAKQKLEMSPNNDFTAEERQALLNAVRGTVNRAYARNKEQLGGSAATAKMDKAGGTIKSWTEIQDWSPAQQMKEIKRGIEASKMASLRISDYKRMTQRIADMVNTDTAPDYLELSEDEKSYFWSVMDELRKETPNFEKEVMSRIGTDEYIKWTYEQVMGKGVTATQIDDLIQSMLESKGYQKLKTERGKTNAVLRMMNNADPDTYNRAYLKTRVPSGAKRRKRPEKFERIKDPRVNKVQGDVRNEQHKTGGYAGTGTIRKAKVRPVKSSDYRDTRKQPTKVKPTKVKGMPTTKL